ncbi:MAG: alpha/beta fold hydrolase [Acidimicrobiales bacterium]|nr:alpha/beta fold hydrolase [Acidimicrobiales bacterium]
MRRGLGWLVKAAIGVLVFLVVAVVVVRVVGERAQPHEPGDFYSAPDDLASTEPGAVVRSEEIPDYTDLGTAHRVLYVSRDIDGNPTPVSGVVLVPDAPAPPEGRPILVYTHGTVGVASRCAPSLQSRDRHPMFGEGADLFLERGYVVVATDYQGLGTPGPHPYLVGDVAAMNALDSARAALAMDGVDARPEFAVWGHSQGGHASLFTGELASSYAPELGMVAVAAGGPVPDPIGLIEVNIETTIGKVLVSMALQSWAEVHDDASLDQIVAPAARPILRDIARNCIYDPAQILQSLPGALALKIRFLSTPPWQVEPWKTIAAENTPGSRPIGVPMLVVASDADTVITPEVTDRYIEGRCDAGEELEVLALSGVNHAVVGVEAAPDVADWMDARFAGEPATSSCSG